MISRNDASNTAVPILIRMGMIVEDPFYTVLVEHARNAENGTLANEKKNQILLYKLMLEA